MKNETLELAKALIRRKSITPADEGCQQLIIDRLVPLGFKPEIIKCGDVTNLFIRHGTGRPLVVLAGHTDVVPPGPREPDVQLAEGGPARLRHTGTSSSSMRTMPATGIFTQSGRLLSS